MAHRSNEEKKQAKKYFVELNYTMHEISKMMDIPYVTIVSWSEAKKDKDGIVIRKKWTDEKRDYIIGYERTKKQVVAELMEKKALEHSGLIEETNERQRKQAAFISMSIFNRIFASVKKIPLYRKNKKGKYVPYELTTLDVPDIKGLVIAYNTITKCERVALNIPTNIESVGSNSIDDLLKEFDIERKLNNEDNIIEFNNNTIEEENIKTDKSLIENIDDLIQQ